MFLRRSLAIAVLASLLLSSCADDEPKPDIPPPTTSPPSTSATTEPVDPLAYPAEAMEPTKAGAEVLIRHYFDMFNHFLASGDAAPVRKLYGPQCGYCEVPIQVFERGFSQGHTYEGSERLVELDLRKLRDSLGVPTALAMVITELSGIVERDKNGKVVTRIPANPDQAYDYYVAFQNGKWTISNAEDAK